MRAPLAPGETFAVYGGMSTPSPPVVGIFNSSEDTTTLLRIAFEQAGFLAVTAFTHAIRDGHVALDAWIRQHRPDVIVYDIALPYDANWRLFQNIKSSPACNGITFVLTTTNTLRVREATGETASLHEIVGKPYDLQQLIDLVRNALSKRP